MAHAAYVLGSSKTITKRYYAHIVTTGVILNVTT